MQLGQRQCVNCGLVFWHKAGHRCAVNKLVATVNNQPVTVNKEVAVNKVKRGIYPDTDKRRGYMKEYMRLKRVSSHPEKMADLVGVSECSHFKECEADPSLRICAVCLRATPRATYTEHMNGHGYETLNVVQGG
jgi:hypothetical protein